METDQQWMPRARLADSGFLKPHNHENLLQKHHIGLDRDQAGLLPGAMPQPGLQTDIVPLPKP